MQFVGRFAFVVEPNRAFVRRMLEGEHELFDKWFGHFPLRLALEPALFAALLEIEPPVACLVASEHFDLIFGMEKKHFISFDIPFVPKKKILYKRKSFFDS